MTMFPLLHHCVLLVGLVFVGPLLVQEAYGAPAAPTPAALTPEAFGAEAAAAQRLITGCALDVAACNAEALPPDAEVRRADGTRFRGSWLWLRETMGAAKVASASERGTLMAHAGEHLREVLAQAGQAPESSTPALQQQAHRAAAAVLARSEFGAAAAGPTWIDRQIARVQDWFLRLLLGMDRIGTHNPWLAPLVEWTCFLLAAGGLVFFVRRSLARGELRVALNGHAAAAASAGRDAGDWARLAGESAATGDWRAAVHGLYWSAIVSLEARRAWRPNPTRTPREYLRLLPPGSAAQKALRGLTASLERVWYGHAEATEGDFRTAQGFVAAVAAADLKRAAPRAHGDGEGTPAMASLGAT